MPSAMTFCLCFRLKQPGGGHVDAGAGILHDHHAKARLTKSRAAKKQQMLVAMPQITTVVIVSPRGKERIGRDVGR